MKTQLFRTLIFAATLGFSGHLAAQESLATYLVDFGGSIVPVDPSNSWNLLETSTGQDDFGILENLITSTGEVSTVSISMISRFNGANTVGATDSALYPLDATSDSLYGNTEVWGGLTDVFPSFKLTGLDPGNSHTLTFYAARLGVSDNRETKYTVAGAGGEIVVLFDPANNSTDQSVQVEEIFPTEAGEITVSLSPGENNSNGNHFTYLNVLQLDVETGNAQGDVSITNDPESVTVTEYEPASFSVTATGGGPYTVQWNKNGSPIPDAVDFTYSIPETTLDLNGASYTATVSNATSSDTSEAAILTVNADVVTPTIVGVRANGPSAVLLTFSEQLDSVSAAAPLSYMVVGSNGSIPVSSATLGGDGTEVQLLLGGPLTSTFTVSVPGVTDRAGNAIEVAMNTVTGSAPAAGLTTYLVDFGGGTTPTDPANTWNLLATSVGQDDFGILENLVTTSGDLSNISIAMISRFNGANTAGATNSLIYPVEATSDSLYGNTEDWQGLTDVFPSFKLTGLDSNSAHTLTFYAARLGVGDNRETKYTVTGADGEIVVLFDPANNSTDQSVKIEGIFPDEAGEITIRLTPGENNNNANHFTYLNALQIDIEPGASQGLRITDFQIDSETNEMTLSWTAAGNARYSIFYTEDLSGSQGDFELADSIADNGLDDLDPEPGHIRYQFDHPSPTKPKLFFDVRK